MKNQRLKNFFGSLGIFSILFAPLNSNLDAKHCSSSSSSSSSFHQKGNEYDYIIVGNGTAGAVLARKLSDNKKHSVLVLEAGQNLSDDPIVLNPNAFSVLNDLSYNPKYAVTYALPLPTLLQTTTYTEGRMWGGGSAHNYVQAVRGTPSIYDGWATASGDSRWTYNNLLPTMKGLETYTQNATPVDYAERGTNGPLYVSQAPPVDADPFVQACAIATGTSIIDDYNAPPMGNIGFSAQQQYVTPPFGSPNSIRSFSINAFLPRDVVTHDGKGRHGRKLQITSNAFVSKLLFKGKKAVGVEYALSPDNGEFLTAYAKKKIILCAGAVHTPAILERSGIGDSSVLTPLGIPVLVDNKNVGANLINHYGARAIIRGNVNVAAMGFTDASPYFPNDGQRRLQFIPAKGNGVIALTMFMVEPKSRGNLHIVSRNPFTDPLINLNMYSDGPYTQPGTDANLVVSALKIAKDIATQFGSVVLAPPNYSSDAALFDQASNSPFATVSAHITGTTRMGTSINDGVVDGTLHVFGVKNLMICDLGAAPVTPDGNTAFGVFTMALEAADILGAN